MFEPDWEYVVHTRTSSGGPSILDRLFEPRFLLLLNPRSLLFEKRTKPETINFLTEELRSLLCVWLCLLGPVAGRRGLLAGTLTAGCRTAHGAPPGQHGGGDHKRAVFQQQRLS